MVMGGGGGGGGEWSAPRLSPSASFARDETRVGVLNTTLKSHTNAQTRLTLADSHGDICPSNLQGITELIALVHTTWKQAQHGK